MNKVKIMLHFDSKCEIVLINFLSTCKPIVAVSDNLILSEPLGTVGVLISFT